MDINKTNDFLLVQMLHLNLDDETITLLGGLYNYNFTFSSITINVQKEMKSQILRVLPVKVLTVLAKRV